MGDLGTRLARLVYLHREGKVFLLLREFECPRTIFIFKNNNNNNNTFKKIETKLPSTWYPRPPTWNPRCSTLDKKIDSSMSMYDSTKTHSRALPSPKASFFLAAKAFRVTWSMRKCFPPVRLGYVTETN